MKAAVHTDMFKLDVVTREKPPVAECDDVLIRVAAVGICGSDKHDLETPPRTPQIPGHEFAGVIEDIGSEPAGFKIGDRVLVKPNTRCGVCEACKQKPRAECEKVLVYGCRGNQPPGAMAEYVLVRTENLSKIPDDVPLEDIAFVDPLAVAIHAVNLGPDVAGHNCVIMGAGAIGLLLAQVLRVRGAQRIALVDISQSRFQVAAQLGDFACFPGDDVDSLIPQLEAFDSDVYYELAGGEAPTLNAAIRGIRHGGTILLVSQRPKGVWLDYQPVMYKQLKLQGVAMTSDESWSEAIDLISDGRVNVKPLITHRYSLDEVNEAIDTAVHGDSIKVIIKPNGDLF